MVAPSGGSNFLSDLFDEFRHVIDLFDRNHVKLRIVLFRNRKFQSERMKRVFRPSLACRILRNMRTVDFRNPVGTALAESVCLSRLRQATSGLRHRTSSVGRREQPHDLIFKQFFLGDESHSCVARKLVESIGGQSGPATRICKTARRQSPS
jgi:hypothetical protein